MKVGDVNVPHTDVGNAQLFAHEHQDHLRWVPHWKTWVRYDGKRWERIGEGEVTPLAMTTIRKLYKSAADILDPDERTKLITHALRSESAGRLEGMVRLSKGLMGVDSTTFDRDPYALNVQNGTINLRTGELRPHHPADMLTKIAAAEYHPDAACPRWDAFLSLVLPDAEVRTFVQRFAGYSITGDVSEELLIYPHGRGANGKTTIVETFMDVLGEYAKSGAQDLLTAKTHDDHPTGVADLQGARMVVLSETEAGRQWTEVMVKRLTSNERIKARFMKKDFFEFMPTHKFWIPANHKMRIRGQDDGIWRRIGLVPFEIKIPDSEKDKHWRQKLLSGYTDGGGIEHASERSGVLAWMVRGCLDWQHSGLPLPKVIDDANRQYRRDQDKLGPFLEDECERVADAITKPKDLYNRYVAHTGHADAWDFNNFREGLLERGYEEGRSTTMRGIRGLRLKERTGLFGKPSNDK